MDAVHPSPSAGFVVAVSVGGRSYRCEATMVTRWAGEVSAAAPRPEYPRPGAVRPEWSSLNGVWEFAFDPGDVGLAAGWAGSGRSLPGRIVVPWSFEAPLSGIGDGRVATIHDVVWYRRAFEVPAFWRGRHVLLHFGAVDWDAQVWVNGRPVGHHRGGYTPFGFDITPALRPSGPQEVVVRAFDPTRPEDVAYQPRGKQTSWTFPQRIFYTRTTGIWQSVWLEPVASAHIDALALRPDLEQGRLAVTAATPDAFGALLGVTVTRDGRRVARGEARVEGPTTSLTVSVPDPAPWSPEHPTLYDVALTLRRDNTVVDHLTSYTAFRTIGTRGGMITLNGRPYFLKGVLDQGFWPDGVYTAPSDDALRADVELAKALGFNLVREHVKVEDPRFYYWCDRLGLLVAQDMPNPASLWSDEARTDFLDEWGDVVRALAAHPSIIMWLAFNENWGHPGPFQQDVVEATHALDPTRPVVDNSGGAQSPVSDLRDYHAYRNQPLELLDPQERRPQWLGETGGREVALVDHVWTPPAPPTGEPADAPRSAPSFDLDALRRAYTSLVPPLISAPRLAGFVYTQLYDVEREYNGLATYDRVLKLPANEITALNRPATPAGT